MLTYNGSTYTWMGRELRKITNGSNTYSYKYNADGIRTSKTVNGTTTEFFLNGTQILAQKTGDSVMRFIYDSTGKRVGFANGTMLFYYLYNLQGDVVAIVRAATGQIVATYSYDAWGNCTVTNATGYAVGDKNPFRYRGYYYDTETGLYYLNSRYYNPEFGRFINVDSELAGVGGNMQGYNLFAYCFNNPVNMSDPDGNWPKWLTGALNVLSGTLQMAAGSALGAAMGWTGFGAVAAGFLMVHGAATATQGIGQIVNSAVGSAVLREDNIVKTGVQAVGGAIGGQTGAAVAGFAYDALTFAVNVYAGQAMATMPKARFSNNISQLNSGSNMRYPGNNPAKCDIPGFEWRGSGSPLTGRGNFVNPRTGEWLHPDLSHGPPIGPHWDYGIRGQSQTFRIFPDSTILPK